MNTLVEVQVELDDGTETKMIAKIEKVKETEYVVRYLSKKPSGVYNYEVGTFTIDKECVSGFYDSCNEADAGFKRVETGWVMTGDEDDSDYSPPTTDEDESETDTDSESDSCTESEETEED